MSTAAGHYIVKQGDWLSKIARQFGISNWQTIWNDPANEALRNERKSPSILFPGDRIYIPATADKQSDGDTEKRHEFTTKTDGVRVRIKVFDSEKQPRAGVAYTFQAGTMTVNGQTTQDGMVIQHVKPAADSAILTIDNRSIVFQLGYLDPIEEISGVQARLTNLGYDCGSIDGIYGPKTKSGIMAFQRECPPLVVDGICGPKTRAKLLEIYGC